MKKPFILTLAFLIFLSRANIIYAADYSPYIYEKQVVKNLPDLSTNAYKLKLESEVQKIITAGGRLDPLFQDQGITGAKYYFGYPGEELLNLCQAYPYLSSTLKTSTATYIKGQLSQTFSTAYYPQTFGDNIDETRGLRREYYPILKNLPLNVWPQTTVPVTGIYVIWSCANALNDSSIATTYWSNVQSSYNSFASSGSAVDTYPKLLGLIGYVRLATLTNNTANIAAAVDKINNSSTVLTSFQNTITTGKTNFEVTFNHEWSIPLFFTSRANNQVVTLFGPEAGRFMGDITSTQVKQVFDIIFPYMPDWYMYKGGYGGVGNADASGSHIVKGLELNWFLGSGYSENNMFSPDTSWTYYLIKAYVYKANVSELIKVLDVPYARRGDLYYIGKLTTLLNAYGQTCWTDVRNGTETCEAAPSVPPSASSSPSPTPFKTSDFNQDGIVNEVDAELLISNWLLSTCTTFSCDTNQDSKNNSFDFSWIFKEWGN